MAQLHENARVVLLGRAFACCCPLVAVYSLWVYMSRCAPVEAGWEGGGEEGGIAVFTSRCSARPWSVLAAIRRGGRGHRERVQLRHWVRQRRGGKTGRGR